MRPLQLCQIWCKSAHGASGQTGEIERNFYLFIYLFIYTFVSGTHLWYGPKTLGGASLVWASDLRSRGREFRPRPRRGCVTTLGKLFTPICLHADSLRCHMESLDKVHLPFLKIREHTRDALGLLVMSKAVWRQSCFEILISFVSPTCPVVAEFARHHHINCLFHHSGSQPSVDAHFQSLHRSSATHCQLTSNHLRLCPSFVDVLKHSLFVSLFLTRFCDSTAPSWTS